MREPVIVGNWKMNTMVRQAWTIAAEVTSRLIVWPKSKTKIIICPPFPFLPIVVEQIQAISNMVEVGAQNCSEHQSGAYTGETSINMLRSLGVSHVIIGHSERRQYFYEHSAQLALKVDIALRVNMLPIYCCGESFPTREMGQADTFIKRQIEEGLFHLTKKNIQKVIIAYEPIWAIGSGNNATPQQAQEMHAIIRQHLAKKYGQSIADKIPIIYGGSINPKNARALFSGSDVDGGLVGKASLQPEDFINIIHSIRK